MRRQFFSILIFCGLTLGLLVVFSQMQNEQAEKFVQGSITKRLVARLKVALMAKSAPTAAPVGQLLKNESLRVGQIDTDPDQTEARLQSLAASFTKDDLDELAARALNLRAPEDERFLAVYLLALSNDAKVSALLEGIVRAPFFETRDSESSRGSIEWMLRAEAVEGLIKGDRAQNPSSQAALGRLASTLSNPLLRDRVGRALYALQNGQSVDDLVLKDKAALGHLFSPQTF